MPPQASVKLLKFAVHSILQVQVQKCVFFSWFVVLEWACLLRVQLSCWSTHRTQCTAYCRSKGGVCTVCITTWHSKIEEGQQGECHIMKAHYYPQCS